MAPKTKMAKLLELLPEDSEIILNEYNTFMKTIHKSENKFYVYALCMLNGQPFYIGKGSGDRAWHHLYEFIGSKPKSNSYKHELLSYFINDIKEYPIVFLYEHNLTEDAAYSLEESLIKQYGRVGVDKYGSLVNIMPGGDHITNSQISSSIGGKIGGRTTKDNALGIFSPEYDRGAQTRSNWENGLMDHIDFVANGKIAGAASVKSQRGIHDPTLSHKRSEWAKIGAAALEASGNRGGVCSKKWQDENKEKVVENASKGGCVGGLTHKGKKMWNNGVINKKTHECPGEGWVRGMLMSEKKRAQVYGSFMNRRKNKDATCEPTGSS